MPPREDRFFCAAAALAAAALGERCSLADSFEDSFVWRPTVGCFGAGTADGIAFGAGTPPLSADLWVPFPTETETTAGAAESFPPPRLIFANASTPIFSAEDGTGTGAGAAFLESPPPPLRRGRSPPEEAFDEAFLPRDSPEGCAALLPELDSPSVIHGFAFRSGV